MSLKTIIEPTALNNREEADKAMERLSELAQYQKELEDQAAHSMAAIGAARDAGIAQFAQEMQTLIGNLQHWAEKNRDELVAEGKTYSLTHGDILFRQLKTKIHVQDESAAIETLKQMGLVQFIRTKENLDKHTLLRQEEIAKNLPGISIVPGGEQIEIRPFIREA